MLGTAHLRIKDYSLFPTPDSRLPTPDSRPHRGRFFTNTGVNAQIRR
ncbi:MAG: hypothetical protein F6K26_45620 [Moorea sp. SIO2I5]|nr:hypothetical protein [Moorena sp. SIO2I5]